VTDLLAAIFVAFNYENQTVDVFLPHLFVQSFD